MYLVDVGVDPRQVVADSGVDRGQTFAADHAPRRDASHHLATALCAGQWATAVTLENVRKRVLLNRALSQKSLFQVCLQIHPESYEWDLSARPVNLK